MKNARSKLTIASVLLVSIGVTGSAFAAVPAAATAAFTSIETDAAAMLDAGWPILLALTAGFVIMKLFKKVVNKAA
jgi:hypothetical protein